MTIVELNKLQPVEVEYLKKSVMNSIELLCRYIGKTAATATYDEMTNYLGRLIEMRNVLESIEMHQAYNKTFGDM